jgi:iron complex transport system ATP-binding protein
VDVHVDREAVVVTGAIPLVVLSSAVAGGGFATARAIVNVHVHKNYPWHAGDVALDEFTSRRSIPTPWVGLLTSAWTDRAEVAVERGDGVTALAVATVGLGNVIAAGLTPPALAPSASTINTIVVVDADPDPAALVNAVMTVTEVKALVLREAGVRCADGHASGGTSTDAVVLAATGRGKRCRFGGPISDLGWAVARASRAALTAGVRRWLEDHR